MAEAARLIAERLLSKEEPEPEEPEEPEEGTEDELSKKYSPSEIPLQ